MLKLCIALCIFSHSKDTLFLYNSRHDSVYSATIVFKENNFILEKIIQNKTNNRYEYSAGTYIKLGDTIHLISDSSMMINLRGDSAYPILPNYPKEWQNITLELNKFMKQKKSLPYDASIPLYPFDNMLSQNYKIFNIIRVKNNRFDFI